MLDMIHRLKKYPYMWHQDIKKGIHAGYPEGIFPIPLDVKFKAKICRGNRVSPMGKRPARFGII
jgi:hypothetical protein